MICNMKLNKIFAMSVLLLALCSAGIFASSFEDVCQRLSVHPVTKGDFTQIKGVKSSRGTRELKSYGSFILCPEGILWDTSKPFPSKMVITATKIVQTSSD